MFSIDVYISWQSTVYPKIFRTKIFSVVLQLHENYKNEIYLTRVSNRMKIKL